MLTIGEGYLYMRTFFGSVLLGMLHAVACWQFPLVGMAVLFVTVTLALAGSGSPKYNAQDHDKNAATTTDDDDAATTTDDDDAATTTDDDDAATTTDDDDAATTTDDDDATATEEAATDDDDAAADNDAAADHDATAADHDAATADDDAAADNDAATTAATRDNAWGGEASKVSVAAKITARKAAWRRRQVTRKPTADNTSPGESNSKAIAAWCARKRRRRRIDL